MTSHWPTFADGQFWCACSNRTFPTEEAWTIHVFCSVLDVLEDQGRVICLWEQPSETADELPHRGA